jgi:hypothetical protein
MVYILMIYADEGDWITKSAAEMAPVMSAHEQLEQDLRKAGKYRGCGGLAPSSAATTVRLGAGKPVITDGPYAETKEQFGGYYLVDAKDLDDALSFAARIPGMGKRAVEVRPVLDLRTP